MDMGDNVNIGLPVPAPLEGELEDSGGERRGRFVAESDSESSSERLLSPERVREDKATLIEVCFADHSPRTSGVECGEGSAPLINRTRLSRASSSTGALLNPLRTISGR